VAVKSFAIFSKLRRDGAVPAATRFQVSLPTVVTILSDFGRRNPATVPALLDEVAMDLTPA